MVVTRLAKRKSVRRARGRTDGREEDILKYTLSYTKSHPIHHTRRHNQTIFSAYLAENRQYRFFPLLLICFNKVYDLF